MTPFTISRLTRTANLILSGLPILTKNAYDSYLAADGFPIKQSPLYNYASDNGRRNFRNTYANRDPTVPSLLWEIRRERRAELMFEGFRKDDLNRWRKFS